MTFSIYLKESPLFLLLSVQKSFEKEIEKGLKNTDITFKEGLILLTLLFEKNSVGPSHLIKTLSLSKALISQSLTRLEGIKLIKRALCQDDARKTSIELTSLGRKKANELIGIFEGIDHEIETLLGKEKLHNFTNALNFLQN